MGNRVRGGKVGGKAKANGKCRKGTRPQPHRDVDADKSLAIPRNGCAQSRKVFLAQFQTTVDTRTPHTERTGRITLILFTETGHGPMNMCAQGLW
jgi:hypothetical protein